VTRYQAFVSYHSFFVQPVLQRRHSVGY